MYTYNALFIYIHIPIQIPMSATLLYLLVVVYVCVFCPICPGFISYYYCMYNKFVLHLFIVYLYMYCNCVHNYRTHMYKAGLPQCL